MVFCYRFLNHSLCQYWLHGDSLLTFIHHCKIIFLVIKKKIIIFLCILVFCVAYLLVINNQFIFIWHFICWEKKTSYTFHICVWPNFIKMHFGLHSILQGGTWTRTFCRKSLFLQCYSAQRKISFKAFFPRLHFRFWLWNKSVGTGHPVIVI